MPGDEQIPEVAVPTDHQDQVDQLLADYRRSRDQLVSVHRTLAAIRETATSPDGTVTATVSAQGTLTALALTEDAYRWHSPGELSALVVRTADTAVSSAAARAQQVVATVLPPESDPKALLDGTADLRPQEIAPPRAATPVSDGEDSFEHLTWLDDTGRGRV